MNFKAIQTGRDSSLSGKLKDEHVFKSNSEKAALPQHIKPRLSISQLSLLVHLGWSLKERQTLQEVQLSIEMEFPASPSGEKTDRLEDTLCYEGVCETLRNFVKDRPFHLIEKMAKECLSLLKEKHPFMRTRLTLHKTAPPVKGLKGGVTYTCGEAF